MIKLSRHFFICAIASVGLLLNSPAIAVTFNAKVIKVIDGDSLVVKSGLRTTEVRLSGIDAPEYSQTYGKICGNQLRGKILGKNVQLKTVDTDRYGRSVAVIYLANRNINREIVANGCAWAYRKYLDDNSLIGLEQQARRKKIGLWSKSNPLPPWQYRSYKRR